MTSPDIPLRDEQERDDEQQYTICPDCGEELPWHTCTSPRIRELNDALRKSTDPISALMMNGSLVITRGIAARGQPFIARAVQAVRCFSAFDDQNDPYREHDYASLTCDGQTIFF